MKKLVKYLLLLVALLQIAPATAQQAAAFFVIMPDTLLATLPTNRRKDMVDYARLQKWEYVENSLGGKSRITALSDSHITIELSQYSTLEVSLLAVNDSTTLIALLRTTTGGAPNSHLALYNTQWQKLPLSTYITLPEPSLFFKENAEALAASQRVDMLLASYKFNADGKRLIVTPSFKEYMTEELYKEIAPHLCTSPLSYRWQEGGFRLEP